MPTLLTQKQINSKYKQLKSQLKFSSNKDIRQHYYSLTQWRNLRKSYLMSQPLDELQLIDDAVVAASDVHHIISPFLCSHNEYELLLLLLDPDNLISLSKETHGNVHSNIDALSDSQIAEIEKRKNNLRLKYNFRF